MRSINVETQKTKLALVESKLKVRTYIFENYKSKRVEQLINELSINSKKFAANRIVLGGVVNDDGFINLDVNKAKNIIKNDKRELKAITNTIKNSQAIEFEKRKKAKGEFNNHGGANKQIARDIMTEYVTNGTLGKVLSLPSHTAKLELQILDKISSGLDFIACERELDVFHKLVGTILNNKKLKKSVKPTFGEIGDVIYNSKSDEYAHMILDYCGTINTFHKEIEFAVKHDILKLNGTMSITLSKIGLGNSKGIIGELLSQFPADCFTNEKQTDIGIKLFLNKILKSNYKVEKIFNYCDTSPMVLIVIKRIG
jgi:hypothetical protein